MSLVATSEAAPLHSGRHISMQRHILLRMTWANSLPVTREKCETAVVTAFKTGLLLENYNYVAIFQILRDLLLLSDGKEEALKPVRQAASGSCLVQ